MRIWHQSATDLTKFPKYSESINDHARRVLDPGVTAKIHGWPSGIRPDYAGDLMQHPYMRLLYERIATEAALTAEREGYDVFAIGTNLDIGLQYCRSVVDIPVVGATETSMHVAGLFGRKFAYITLTGYLQEHLTVCVEKNGLKDRLAGVFILSDHFNGNDRTIEQIPIYEIVNERPDELERIFMAKCEEAIALGAEVLIPGEGILNEFIFQHRITECRGRTILDSNAVLWNAGIMLANLRTKSSIKASRGYTYYKPEEKLMKMVNDIYSTLPFSGFTFSE